MSAIDEIGLTREVFDRLYHDNNGFNRRFNENHPLRADGESAYSFAREGAEMLVKEKDDVASGLLDYKV